MAKTETMERTYNVPLRMEYQKAPSWNRTKKAVTALKQFLSKHMKSEDIRLSNNINKELWKHGIKNPPHHVKVTVSKDEKGVVTAELFGLAEKKSEVKSTKLEKTVEEKAVKTEPKAVKKSEKKK